MNFLFYVIQYEMESKYQEKSMLTDLFTENKFWGWAGLLAIFLSGCLIFIFQVRIWDEEDKISKK